MREGQACIVSFGEDSTHKSRIDTTALGRGPSWPVVPWP